MDNKELVQVKSFNIIGEDERGITAEFFLSRKQSDFVFITRKAGSLSGNTYHEGKNQGTSPKIFLLIEGKIEFEYRDITNGEKFTQTIESPAQIEVQPRVTHAVRALTDIIIFECNSLADIQGDRVREPV
ncbi:MAG: hypothetical protein Q8M03_07825 [Legionella sp.]|nr:hypothetical protein [Legionella sp.]